MISKQTQRLFHLKEPWSNPEPQWTLYNTAEALRISAILLQPFMPTKSLETLQLLGVDTSDPSKRTFSATTYGSDPDYGEGVGVNKVTHLFPRLTSER